MLRGLLRSQSVAPDEIAVLDTIFSSDGVVAGPKGFLKQAVDAIHRAGGLFVADEVQPGFGRTGDSMWGFERHGVSPDLVTVGKPMGNGYPMAGVIVRPELVADFGEKARYFNTFGGNPIAAAAGMAVLKVIEEEGLVARARDVGAYIQDGMRQLAEKYPAIGDVRGAGLFIGVELVSDMATKSPDAATTTKLVNGLRERRILISASRPGANVLKIRPPLVFSPENADTLFEGMEDVFKSL
ncbi:aminotransferase class III-fold pyridoxal phosphate-dependent enzyme [Rhodopseudomonas palustris]|uniref:aspartate aminotransferase family protein n=1 Tax=Rhodopseudomonas palustris TaxID=1076 RepID=UPI002ACD7A62|nr:aminotransferase class III-fold pyridoxal phosphate-dependent enzyme [Rhodopseudomonas palustris]WQG97857.1 aminotransferase class III-fold pyridoxal phosphate-dependent enzyme [Rhodopseudomonas palustris]